MMFGQYGAYIIPAYAATLVTIAGLIVRTNLDYRARLREIAELERLGVKRRSQANTNG